MSEEKLFTIIAERDPALYVAKELIIGVLPFAEIYSSVLPSGFSVKSEVKEEGLVTKEIITLYKDSEQIAQLVMEDYGFTMVYRVRVRKKYVDDIIKALVPVREVVHGTLIEKLKALRSK